MTETIIRSKHTMFNIKDRTLYPMEYFDTKQIYIHKIIFDDKSVYFNKRIEAYPIYDYNLILFKLIAKLLGVNDIYANKYHFKFDIPNDKTKTDLLTLLMDVTDKKVYTI